MTLAVDIGGSGINAGVLTEMGALLSDRVRIDTPVGRHPRALVEAVRALVRPLPPFERVIVSNEAGIRGGIALWGTRYDTA